VNGILKRALISFGFLQEFKPDGAITFNLTPDRVQKVKIRDLVEEIKKIGYPSSLYQVTDRYDPFFGPPFLMATDSSVMSIRVQFGNFTTDLPGPCRSSPLENDLTDDILYFRNAVCETSASNNFYDCCRNYRSYLQSAVSLIDCFLNRYAELAGGGRSRERSALSRRKIRAKNGSMPGQRDLHPLNFRLSKIRWNGRNSTSSAEPGTNLSTRRSPTSESAYRCYRLISTPCGRESAACY
jgi:hypothetical protein